MGEVSEDFLSYPDGGYSRLWSAHRPQLDELALSPFGRNGGKRGKPEKPRNDWLPSRRWLFVTDQGISQNIEQMLGDEVVF